jgi:mRNA interferase RelE/StbE
MFYTIVVLPRARKQLRKFDPTVRAPIEAAIDALAHEPRPHGVTKLVGEQHTYRIKAGKNYRVVYDIFDDRLVIDVVRVAHRREVYQDRA